MNKKCFLRCVKNPSTKLQSKEEDCIKMCIRNYSDCANIILKNSEEL